MYTRGLLFLFFWTLGFSKLGLSYFSFIVTALLVCLLHRPFQKNALVYLFGFVVSCAVQNSLLNGQFPKSLESKDLRVTGCIAGISQDQGVLGLRLENLYIEVPIIKNTRRRMSQELAFQGATAKLGVANMSIKVNVYPYVKAAQIPMQAQSKTTSATSLIGQRVTLILRLKGAKNYLNEASFNYTRWAALKNQWATGYVKEWVDHAGTCRLDMQPHIAIEKLRQRLLDRLNEHPYASRIAPITLNMWSALVLGQTSALTTSQWQLLAATGTTHLLVISGLHVGLMALLVMQLVRLILMPVAITSAFGIRMCAWAGLMGALVFTLISGFGLPAQRALIMLCGLMWGTLWGLQISFTQRFLGAFCITLLLQPSSASSLGFWLSYTAVLALALVWYRSQGNFWWHRIIKLIAAQGALSILLAPVIALGTGSLSLVGPLLNIVLVPLFGVFIIPVMLVLSFVHFFVLLPEPVYIVINHVFIFIWQALEWAGGFKGSQIFLGNLPKASLIFVLVIASLSLLIRHIHWPLAILSLPLFLGVLMLVWDEKSQHNLLKPKAIILSVFDVGQGLSLAVQQGQHTLLYDVGNRFNSGFSLANAVVVPELLDQGVSDIDMLVVSHWDMDHSGGLEDAIKGLNVKRLMLPIKVDRQRERFLRDLSLPTQRCETSQWETLWKEGDSALMWRTLSLKGDHLNANNASCVIVLDLFGRKLLIAADIEAKAEAMLVNRALASDADSLTSDILIAPHHGSKTSSTKEFLGAVNPSYVLVSSGKNNSYGHPHAAVTKRYFEQGSQWFNTARHGKIQIVFEPNGSYQVSLFVD